MPSRLFTAVRLGALHLPNRIVMAPMTRSRADAGDVPTATMAEYYRQRAGAGLIVTEGTQPSTSGKGYHRTPGIHSAEQIEGWRLVADAVHAEGGRIVMQLMHCGRVSVRANKANDAPTVAPSAITCRDPIPGPDGVPVPTETPHALTIDEIQAVIAEYAQAARNAREAGMDGVELHGASGYLPQQFLNATSNRRTDRYGGPVANRIRFAIEALEAMAGAIGADRVGFRVAPGNPYNDMPDDDPAASYGPLLEAAGRLGLAYLHVVDMSRADFDALALVRAHWKGALIVNNNLTLESAEAVLESGVADAVSFGRPFIANPDLVARLAGGHPLAQPNRATLYAGDHQGYTDYPALDATGVS